MCERGWEKGGKATHLAISLADPPMPCLVPGDLLHRRSEKSVFVKVPFLAHALAVFEDFLKGGVASVGPDRESVLLADWQSWPDSEPTRRVCILVARHVLRFLEVWEVLTVKSVESVGRRGRLTKSANPIRIADQGT